MLSAKGLYEWKLVDINTGETVSQGSQWNLITDSLMYNLCTYYLLPGEIYLKIVLSDTTPVPATTSYDYRERGISHSKISITASGNYQDNNDGILNKKWTDYNFAPPGSPRTINIIGLSMSASAGYEYFPYNNFISFIELTSPITQQVTQYFYVKYTLFFNYSYGGGDLPDNRYLDYYLNANILGIIPTLFGWSADYDYRDNRIKRHVTIFSEPVTSNNVMRAVPVIYTTSLTDVKTDLGSRMARRIEKSFSTTDIPGPIGSVCQIIDYSYWIIYPTMRGYLKHTLGYSPIDGSAPSVSRIFIHPASRIAQIFSDPAYPPSSNGAVTISGTPTSLAPIVGRIKIEKTGDASDIVDEVVAAADVSTVTNEFTVVQTWATDDILQINNDLDDPPAPLSEATDYYVIYVDPTHIKLSTSLGGSEITLLDQGTGNNTLVRQNTGKYSLELEPYANGITLSHLPMGIDKDNKTQPALLSNNADTGEGGTGWDTDKSFLIRGIFHVSDLGDANNFVYSIQKSRVSAELTVCRWKFWTIETSVALCKFGTSSTKYRSLVKNGTDVYIATNAGIYKYDITTPTVAPALMTITGIIDSNVTDVAMDVTSGYLWSGHTTGLSKIDLGTLIATQYITGTGQELEGMDANDAYISAGQLSADNGRVLKAGGGSAILGGYSRPWMLQDGVGWYLLTTYSTRSGTLRKGTNEVVLFYTTSYSASPYIYRLAVTVTGKGTGSSVTQESVYVEVNPYYMDQTNAPTQMVQVSNTKFIFDYFWRNGSNGQKSIRSICYTVNNSYTYFNEIGEPDYYGLSLEEQVWRFALGRDLINFSSEQYGTISQYLKLAVLGDIGTPYSFGWDGANWLTSDTTARYIPKTGTQSLLDGLSVAFNNATGKPWDQQFVSGERFTFMYGPMKFKDNLQTMNLRARSYFTEVTYASGVSVSVPGAAAYTYHITEASDPNFREVDTYDLVVTVKEGSTAYTPYTLPAGSAFTTNYLTGIITVGVNIPTGTVCHVSSTGFLPLPLKYKGVYYAINIDATRIQLALTYADAIGTVPITLFDNGISGTHTLYQLAPATGEYFLGMNGVFVFSAADTGKALTLDYTATYYS